MSIDFILPDIGEGIVECELLKWLVAEGDVIEEDQPVAEVMTDKATVEIPAMQNGIVEKLYYREGDVAKVHQPLFRLKDDDKSSSHSIENSDSKREEVEEHAMHSMSADVFLLPDIGEGIVECEIVKWCVQEQEFVAEDQVVVEVMTDKAVVEIPAKHAGQITKLHYGEGHIAKVHAPLFELLHAVSEETQEACASDEILPDKMHPPSQLEVVNRVAKQIQRTTYTQGENSIPKVESKRPIASPAVRRLARERGLDIYNIKGTGAKGRILKTDVLRVENANPLVHERDVSTVVETPNRSRSESGSLAGSTTSSITDSTTGKRVPIKGLHAAMLKQMQESASTIPHFSVSDELEMDELILLRNELKPVFEKEGITLSFMPFFIKALSMSLHQFPILNSTVSDDEQALHYIDQHNIGLAIDSIQGLLVPNIKNVQCLSLKEIAVEVNRLVDAGRAGKLSREDMHGGTITISNIGIIGGITATPIINKPEVAIVALGKTRKLPRFNENEQVIAKHIMHINWSGDHRVIDGATMVKFNNCWLDYLRSPEKMLIELR